MTDFKIGDIVVLKRKNNALLVDDLFISTSSLLENEKYIVTKVDKKLIREKNHTIINVKQYKKNDIDYSCFYDGDCFKKNNISLRRLLK